MKGFAIVLLCVIAAVQERPDVLQIYGGLHEGQLTVQVQLVWLDRSAALTVVNHQRALAVQGENPWVVHLRLAIGTSGFLETAVGALIDNSWVLTTAEGILDQRFIWVRLGCEEVIRPDLVLETTNVRVHEDYDPATGLNNIALINLNRFVDSTANIAPIGLPAASSDIGYSANYCSFGQTEQNAPGEFLSCWDVTQVAVNNYAVIVEGDDISASRFDIGAPLVEDGNLVGLLTQADEYSGDRAVFIRTSAYVNWISGMTGVDFNRAAPAPAPEGPQDVIIVN